MTPTASLQGQRVLVLGATGFVGGRLVERLVVESGAQVRVLMRRVAAGVPAVRFPIEAHLGDVADPEAVGRAVEGCDVVVNLAKGSGPDAAHRRAVDVDAAGHVVEAAARAGARVVHVSSLAVYDLPRDGDVDERSPDAPAGDPYSDNKLAGERLALATGEQRGVPVTVLQPTVVYGPRATTHGSEIIEELREGGLLLVDGGAGICNAVYLDDVVTAVLLAAVREQAAGQRLLVSGPEHPTWAEFFGAFERMLGRSCTVSMSEQEALALWRRSRRRSPSVAAEALRAVRERPEVRERLFATREGAFARRTAERVAPGLLRSAKGWVKRDGEPVGGEEAPGQAQAQAQAQAPAPAQAVPARPWLVEYLAKRARVQQHRAAELLGYEPAFGLEEGMRLTEAWARWARLLD